MTGSRSELPARLARVHAWTRAQPWLGRFTLLNRVLLAIAFLPTGLVKATGNRFTLLPVSDPVGFFFEAMYRTGPYWIFIGLVQLAAAILILIPRTALLGALLFLPVTLSIVLITWGVGFAGTTPVAAGMLLSVTYLLCWDGDRVWQALAILFRTAPGPRLLQGAHAIELLGWALGATTGIGLFLVARGLLARSLTPALLLSGLAAAAVVVAGWVIAAYRRPR